jgi:hypothetical protein
MAEVKKEQEVNKPVVIQNFVYARPPHRTQFGISDWRLGIESAELKFMPNRVVLYDIYEDIKLDPHLSKQWEKRIENVTNVNWCFSVKDVEVPEMKDFCGSLEFRKILTEIMQQKAWGITLLELGVKDEIVMGEVKKKLLIYDVPRKHIRPDVGTIVKEQYDTATAPFCINYREGTYKNYMVEVGEPKDLGLFLEIAPYVLLKKGGVSDWSLFVQLFGQPFREYRYNGYNEIDRIMLEKSAQEMASAPYIILPDGSEVKLHEIKNNNTGQTHQGLVDYCDKMISIRILGNMLTTDNTNVGSNALGNVHSDTQDDVFDADMLFVKTILLSRIAPILYNLGYPVKGGMFHPREEKSLDDILNRLKLLKAVKDLGAPISDDTIYQDSGVEKPKDYDAQKADMAAKAEAKNTGFGAKPVMPGKKKQKPKNLSAEEQSLWTSFRQYLADFFDPAP